MVHEVFVGFATLCLITHRSHPTKVISFLSIWLFLRLEVSIVGLLEDLRGLFVLPARVAIHASNVDRLRLRPLVHPVCLGAKLSFFSISVEVHMSSSAEHI